MVDFFHVLRFYKELVIQTCPSLKGTNWQLCEGVYWFPLTPVLGLCATSNGVSMKIEIVRGLTGDAVNAISHPLGLPFNGKEGVKFGKQIIDTVLNDTHQYLSLFGIPNLLSLTVSYYPDIIPKGVAGYSFTNPQQPEEKTWFPDQFFLDRQSFVSDQRIFVYGGVTVLLYKKEKEATLLTQQLLVGNEFRTPKPVNPLYILKEEDQDEYMAFLKAHKVQVSSIDRIRFRSVSSQSNLGVMDQIHQVVLVHLGDLLGTSLCTAHYLEMCGENTEEKNPLYHILLIRIPEELSAKEAVQELKNLDEKAFDQVAHIFEVSEGYLHRVHSDPRMSKDKIPSREKICIPYV